jgi:hypothetical protein
VVDDISHGGLRILLREEGVSFQRLKTWKTSRDPDYAAKKARIEHLYAIVDGEVIPEQDEPEVVFCMDEFGQLNLMPHPGRQWAERGGKHKDPDREPRPRRRATYNRYGGVRHLFAALDLTGDKLYGHIKPVKRRTRFLEFCRYRRSLQEGCGEQRRDRYTRPTAPGSTGSKPPSSGETAMPTTGAYAPSSTGRTLPDSALLLPGGAAAGRRPLDSHPYDRRHPRDGDVDGW